MSRPKKAVPGAATEKTTRLFAPRKPREGATLTHESIAADLETFRKSGGHIEVLGVTRTLQRIDPPGEASPHHSPDPSPSRTRR